MKKENKSNLLLLIIKIGILFFVTDYLVGTIPQLMTRAVNTGKYGLAFIVEMFAVLVVFIVMLCSKNHYVFTQKRENFFKTLLLGGPLLFIAIYSFIINVPNLFAANANISNIITLALFCVSIGLYEEFLCRGWVLNEFLEKYGKTRKQVLTSIFLSAFIFGMMHISNIWIGGQTVTETISQIAQATCVGVLFGGIYYRSKNIWSVVFLHGFYDFALMLSSVNALKECQYVNEGMSIISIIQVGIICAVYLISSAIILRKSKINHLIEEEKKLTKEQLKKSEKLPIIGILAIIILITMPLPYHLIPESEYEEICYEYKDINIGSNFERHYSNYTTYEYVDQKAIFEPNEYNELITTMNLKITSLYDQVLVEIDDTKVELNYDNYIKLLVLEQTEYYQIAIVEINLTSGESTLHFSNYLHKGNLNTTEEYLNEFKKSFTSIPIPDVSQVGYITTKESTYKYLEIDLGKNNYLILNEDNSLYILK